MKLLGISFGFHDSNVTYFDGSNIYYHKFERSELFKRYQLGNYWSWIYKIQNLFNISIHEIDEIAVWFEPFGYNHLFLDNNLPKNASNIIPEFKTIKHNNITWIPHHYAHSLSYWPITEEEIDISFCIDGAGDNKSWAVYKKNNIIASGIIDYGTIGSGLEVIAEWMGIKSQCAVDHAGKFMGLQSYGKFDENYYSIIKNYNFYNNLDKILSIDEWIKYNQNNIEQAKNNQNNWANTIHKKLGECIIQLFNKYANVNDKIFYTGGVAQNILWNTELKKIYPNLFVAPHSGDDGISLGLIEYLRIKYKLDKFKLKNFPFSQVDIAPNANPSKETIYKAAKILASGKTLGWYQGHGEVGSRALGNRSLLFDPRIENGKEIVNKIKKREFYRPFGASVLKEHVDKYFDYPYDEYMLFASNVKTKDFPSITHIDNTCRIQIVTNNNIIYKKLLQSFYDITGCPVVLNTSLNLAGRAICGHPEEAYEMFFHTELDALVVGDTIITK